MYDVRSDLILQIPYGDTIILGVDIPFKTVTDTFQYHTEQDTVTTSAQIRDVYGNYLSDFKTYATLPDKAVIYCDSLLPVGLHFMDIRFEVNLVDAAFVIPIAIHTEIIGLEIVDSVTRPYYESSDGLKGLEGELNV